MQRCAAAAERTGLAYSVGACSNSTAVWLHGVRCMSQSSVPRSSVMLRLAEGARPIDPLSHSPAHPHSSCNRTRNGRAG